MRIRNSIILLAVSAMLGCSDYDEDRSNPKHAGKILLSGEIEQVYQTRANDNGFAHGDAIGVYFVDYNGTTYNIPLTLRAFIGSLPMMYIGAMTKPISTFMVITPIRKQPLKISNSGILKYGQTKALQELLMPWQDTRPVISYGERLLM